MLASSAFVGLRCLAQERPPTTGEVLTRYGIPLTSESLRAALRDSRSEVRGLAAGELAEMKDTSSLPLILHAMEEEKDANARFNMAASLLALHSPAGNAMLAVVCNDRSQPDEGRRLDAASRLVDAADFQCLPSVLDILEASTDSAVESSALLVIAHAKPIPSSLAERVHTACLAALHDRNPAVRGYASRCFVALGDKTAIRELESALAVEADEPARKEMERSLQRLGESR